ncbi:splicing factor, arginine/serine-rich 19 [Platichthys flesus]|uniref:splicing factor, arginine/serine-rich 19 n=1 Tax=Platichthys flesus TaxID=8260 RepID=UPI002DBC8ACB|nr:splicing factor, arginine/serine-rich 19 [Platichthys flesus]XP_062263316.1 splicing factor, arginine/serine-rich 19 [Platichthys flesus]
MDLTPAPGFKKRAAASSSRHKVGEITWSPPPCSPSLSLSSPSSDPLSPLSTSSSVCASSSVYQDHVKGQTQQTDVSSTSASQAAQSLSTAKPNTICMDFCLHTLIQPSQDCEGKDEKGEMYDPFHPTEGDKEVRMQEGGEGEKYDPFDPTGSPASDTYNGSDKAGGGENMDERGDEEEYPDSTLTDLLSPYLVAKLPLGSKVHCSTIKPGEQRQSADSDHSEIEEGEIVGAAERNQSSKRAERAILSLNSPIVSFFGTKPERILRVLDEDGFVSLCAKGSWEVDREPEEEPVVGVEDLRRKLVSRRKERYLSFPTSSTLSPQPPPPSSHPPASTSSSPLTTPTEQESKKHKSSKSSKDREGQKIKDRKAGEKEERRKKKRKEKVGGGETSKEKEQGHKTGKEVKGMKSSSHKRKKRQHNSPETLQSCNLGRGSDIRHSLSSLSQERHQERFKDKDVYVDRDMDRITKQGRGREKHKEREKNYKSSHRRDDRDLSSRKERERKERHNSSSRERCISKRSKRSREKKEGERERQRERDWLLDGRPVVPPSIQDLNGSDLFAIKRTITVTTTTTTTTVPGSPRLSPTSPCWPKQDPDKPHKRKKKRKWHSTGEVEDRGCCRSRSRSFSPTKYRSFESDRYSEKFEIDVLSLDGEALDSDYPSLEDTPPAGLVPEPPVLSPKTKITLKTERHHQGKKSRTLKKTGKPKSTFSSRIKNKCLSSLMVTSGSPSVSSGLPSTKQAKKLGKDKDRDKCSRKDSGRSGKSNKDSGGSRKGKLQSKVSVLVREGVSSTTGTSVGSGKLGMDMLGPGVTGGSSGGSVVGGSIAVVFCRDNESRSPFLKPCSELPSLGGRSKDLSSMGKRNSLAASPASLTSSAGLKSKKTKPSSITSTSSSSASSPSSSVTKHCRRLAKKTRDKGGAAIVTAACSQANTTAEGWGRTSLDIQSAVGNGNKSVSPHTDQVGPPPCSSSSSTTSVLPPSSSPQQTPPLSIAPLQDTRGSSPDSQTVDSSCKTPDPSFIFENCPTQTSPTLPTSSPASLSAPQGPGLSVTLSTPMAKPPPLDDSSNTLVSPSCSSSSAGCGFTSLSLPPSSSDPSSVSSSSANKPPLPPPPAAHALPWSLQTGVDCTTGGVLALTALLFKMEEANIASRAKAQEFIQATNQILSQANQSQSQQHGPPSSATASSQIPPPPSVPPPHELSPTQFILHSSLPLVGCSKTPTSHLHSSIGGGYIQTPPSIMPSGLSGVTGTSGDTGWDNESKDPDKYLKKLHTQERAVEEVKLAIKPYYQRKDINKDEYKDILRKAVHKICHSRTGEINPVKVSNLVKLYVQRYKYFRKHGRKMDDEERIDREPGALQSSDY